MKNTIFKIILVLTLVQFCSCEDFLDTMPKGKTIPSTVQELNWLLNDFNRMSLGTINGICMGDDLFLTDNTYNNYSISRPFLKGYAGERTLYTADQFDWDWKTLYEQVWTTNYILEKIDDAPLDGKVENDRKNVKGEALAARANAYFFLVNLYGKHFDASTAAEDLSVPIVKTTDPEQDTKRASVSDVYEFIEEDLDAALELMDVQSTPEINYHYSLVGIYGMKARIALFKQDFDMALDYAEQALSIKSDLWDYNDYINEYNNYAAGIDINTFVARRNTLRTTQDDNVEVILTRSLRWVYSNQYLADFIFYFSDSYASLFPVDDLRLRYFGVYDTNVLKYKFEVTDYTVLGISVPELLLIKAEVHARQGDFNTAMDDLNELRINRIESASYVPLVANNADEALSLVLLEREKEMMFTGMRWYDLRRLIQTGDFTETISRIVDGNLIEITPNPENYIVDIPEDIRIINPDI